MQHSSSYVQGESEQNLSDIGAQALWMLKEVWLEQPIVRFEPIISQQLEVMRRRLETF